MWIQQPLAFAAVAVITLAGIYAAQLCGARVRLGLLKFGRVADVFECENDSGTTWYNVYLPMAHGWTVTRQRWSGPNTKTLIRYSLDGHQGELVLRGREYVDGVILADARNPARARCVTAFTYDLDRDETGNWVGRLRPRLRLGMACWSAIVIGWLLLAGLAATGSRTTITGDSPAAPVPRAGTLQVSGTGTTKIVPCNGGYLSVSGEDNTITVTGHCTSVSVSGNGNHVTDRQHGRGQRVRTRQRGHLSLGFTEGRQRRNVEHRPARLTRTGRRELRIGLRELRGPGCVAGVARCLPAGRTGWG